jgi:alpha-D-ribose 1-methylphosphonate 5-triphosphate synthase subunit PhnH
MLAPGFSDAVRCSQNVFRSVMQAMARPARPLVFQADLAPPGRLTPELAAVALTLADPDAGLWLDEALAADTDVANFLVFHTGARIVVDPVKAAFALVADATAMPPMDSFALGTDAYPDRSTTIVLAVDQLTAGDGLRFCGPGIRGTEAIDPQPLPHRFRAELAANRSIFPRGVDLILVAPGLVAAIPRSSTLVPEPA